VDVSGSLLMTRHFGFPGDSDDLPMVWMIDHWENLQPKPSRIGWAWEATIVISLGLLATLAVYGFIFFYR